MPIKVQSNLPAIKVLESENIFVMPNEVALRQIAKINVIKPMIILSARVRFNTLPNTLILFIHLSSNEIIYYLKLIEV